MKLKNIFKQLLIPSIIGIVSFLIITFLFRGSLGLFDDNQLRIIRNFRNNLSLYEKNINILSFNIRKVFLSGYKDKKGRYSNPVNKYVSDKVHIVGIDDFTLLNIDDKWPFPPNIHNQFLKRLQQFSPETVFFDVLFIDESKSPSILSENTELTDYEKLKISRLYHQSEKDLANEFARFNNVYIGLKVKDSINLNLSLNKKERIRSTEKALLNKNNIPQMVDKELGRQYVSLEPLVTRFLNKVNIGVVNVVPSIIDGTIREYPLGYRYKGKNKNYFVLSAAINIIKNIYYVKSTSIILEKNKVIFQDAKIPNIDLDGKEVLEVLSVEQLIDKLNYKKKARNYKYNSELYQFIINDKLLNDYPDDAFPEYPISVYINQKGEFELLDGREILDATIDAEYQKILCKFHYKQDYIIYLNKNTQKIPINFNGFDILSDDVNKQVLDTQISYEKSSYGELYQKKFPPIIKIKKNTPIKSWIKSPSNKKQIKQIENWFYDYVFEFRRRLVTLYQIETGKKAEKSGDLYDYFKNNIEYLKWLTYAEFIFKNKIRKAIFGKQYKLFPNFLKQLKISYPHIPFDHIVPLSSEISIKLANHVYKDMFDKFYKKIAIIGSFSKETGDIKQSPLGPTYGMFLIANTLSTLLTNNQLTSMSDNVYFETMFFFICAIVFACFYLLPSVRFSVYIFIVTFISLFIFNIYIFIESNYIFSLLPILLINVLTFTSSTIYKVTVESHGRSFLQKTFSQYLSPEVIKQMYKNKDSPTLGGESKVITAIFTDIKGFSSISEELTAHQLVELMNEYLSKMTDIIFEQKGTLDKYIGDAIVGFFGAPNKLEDHSYKACMSTIKMLLANKRLRDKWTKEKLSKSDKIHKSPKEYSEKWVEGDKWPISVQNLCTRIGLCTGEAVIGNMGSDRRKNYTMIGDTVNLAARLESAAKQYGVFILISETTLFHEYTDIQEQKHQSAEYFLYRLIDKIIVKGKTLPVSVYEIINFKDQATKNEKKLISIFQQGTNAYFNREWKKAIDFFEESKKYEPHVEFVNNISPSSIYIDRCHRFENNPPPKEWDGSFILTKK